MKCGVEVIAMQETNSATYRLKFEPMIPHDKSDISAYVTVEVANLSTAQNDYPESSERVFR